MEQGETGRGGRERGEGGEVIEGGREVGNREREEDTHTLAMVGFSNGGVPNFSPLSDGKRGRRRFFLRKCQRK